MSSVIGVATKTPTEVKRYKIDYTDWLDTGETVISTSSVVTGDGTLATISGLVVDVGGLGVTFFIVGGDDGNTYEVVVTSITSGGQTKQDALQVTVASL